MAWTDEDICKIVANSELKDGYYVNLGIGLPTLVANYIPPSMQITLQSENGILGMGAFPTKETVDADLINAGKQTITELPQSSYFSSAESFAMIRGGHINVAILGALQVSEAGDLANWIIPNQTVKGMGGAMDLVAGVQRIIVIMDHVTKTGEPKLLKQCTFPLTGIGCVDKVVTNLGVFEFEEQQMYLTLIAPGVTLEEIKVKTKAEFTVRL
ncbi:3-oxoacid CoA-transferase subunit B [endosymbiont of Acanthamoeba sp. UWC8]|uniref:3-oxoacid CoA-transferase subunit B n=1 Tax=endosymbiont of Acanthamoeba sp. UWC8 TaxID=86106 RepID=UPI0004D113E8|nr:3-oxoacid CoA-transferase subunit B [endosymbiont of Acanthamoeba sp. UWC8]